MIGEELLEKFESEAVFLKGTSKSSVKGETKASLNRRGNELLNNGDVENARRIFITTGYSDGLSRTGDFYKKKGQLIDALRMYWVAHDKKKSSELCMELSLFIKGLLAEDKNIWE
ncbi:MAG: hypothetical protein Pg6A_09000 [Termitinemataceae bacterium]|jgi:hypothetical protein|nr:MAG: hypothetical protein Pg6A_09000 [Termitinemataceae bacterium]